MIAEGEGQDNRAMRYLSYLIAAFIKILSVDAITYAARRLGVLAVCRT